MNIIYADDEKMQLENFRLTVSGLEEMKSLKLFGNSLEAYEWAKDHKVDVAFLDIEMPHMSGMELAKKLKELNPDVYIIFVTAYEQYAVKAFKIRAAGYLLKPYTRADIESELENILSDSRTRREKKICITTMPDFLATINGKNIFNGHSKQEELFALFVDRGNAGITKGDALTCLGEGKLPSDSTYWSWLFRLKNILEEAGMPDLIVTKGNAKYLNTELVDCDLYRMLNGNTEVIEKFTGDYLRRYSWAEEKVVELTRIRKNYEKNLKKS